MNEEERLIKESYKLAESAVKNGNHPFGALLAKDGEVLVTAENTVNTDNDCICHAELNLVSKSYKQLDKETLKYSTLYTSTEPCAMCAGAIYWSGVRKVVFGCSADKLRKIAGKSLEIKAKDVYNGSKDKMEVLGPILEEEGASIHRAFWKEPINT